MTQQPTFPWPDSVEPGVAGVVLNERRQVLLVKRTDNGQWGLPSGHVEKGETVTQAICRELYEETGLIVAVEKLIGVYSDPATQIFCYPSGRITHFVTLSFLCRLRGGVLKADGQEVSAADFFDKEQLPAGLMTMHPRWLEDAWADRQAAVIR